MGTGPTLSGFTAFVRQFMVIDAKTLPDNSIFLPVSLALALGLVNPQLSVAPIPQVDGANVALNPLSQSTPVMTWYDYAVYNLAADILVNQAIDQPGFCFFSDMRKELNINGFTSGVVQSASDESTSVSLVVQEAAQHFTLADVQKMKTPWGRTYLSIAQSYGPSTWGIT